MYKNLISLAKNLIEREESYLEMPFHKLPKHPLAIKKQKILPAFLGEMGLEVRGFLGMVEPWLNSEWLIPSKRPSLYPEGTAFFDQLYFDRINDIKKYFDIREMVGQLYHSKNINITDFQYNLNQGNLDLSIKINDLEALKKIVNAERAIRLAFSDRYSEESSIPSQFHEPLTSVTMPSWSSSMDLNWTAFSAIIPTYKPTSFEHPKFVVQPHIGVQIRNLPTNPERNSNLEKMIQAANHASQLSGYPILVYGANDDILPRGYQYSIDLVPDHKAQLDGELGILKYCKLMIAPDSGWSDLMCWLGIPTLLEQQFYAYGFEGLRPFKPKLLLMNSPVDSESIERLLNASPDEVMLPDPMNALHKVSHLMPNSALIRSFWSEF